MELNMNTEIDYNAKRRKVDIHLADTSFFMNESQSCDKKAGYIESAKTIKNGPHFLSSNYTKLDCQRNLNHTQMANKILLFTVINPTYPITCDILHKICTPISPVLRIVIIRKNGLVQALIEFKSVNEANDVKESLHGCDIYSGGCTLKIDFSRNSNQLNVYKNDGESWDYTNDIANPDGSSKTGTNLTPRRVLLDTPSFINHKSTAKMSGHLHLDPFKTSILPFPTISPGHANIVNITKTENPNENSNRGSVCIVYGLNANKMNPSGIFNLFCLYGNVMRIKFLKTKEGCAMVQMGDFLAVERLISLLHGVSLFESDLKINCSKQSILLDVHNPYRLPDGTLSFQDFAKSNLNRFSTPCMASKNRIQRPTNALHFFNAPPNIEKSYIVEMFKNGGEHMKPISLEVFPSKSEKSSSGLISFETREQALEALVIFNHQPVLSSTSKNPYIMKLCFSTSNRSSV